MVPDRISDSACCDSHVRFLNNYLHFVSIQTIQQTLQCNTVTADSCSDIKIDFERSHDNDSDPDKELLCQNCMVQFV
jgi:hypothetical protein